MAATIARATGYDKSRVKQVHRLGSQSSEAQAATWRTFVDAVVKRDGSGHVRVSRDGLLLHHFEFGPEGEL